MNQEDNGSETDFASESQPASVAIRNTRSTRRNWRQTRRMLQHHQATWSAASAEMVETARSDAHGEEDLQRDAREQEATLGSSLGSGSEFSGVAKKQIRSQVQTVFSVDAIHRVFSTFSDEKREIVKSIGFEALLKLYPQVKFPRLLVLWILRNMDADSGTIFLSNGDTLPYTEGDVHLVLGIPHSETNVKCGFTGSSRDLNTVKYKLMLGKGEDLTLEYIETLLLHDYGNPMTEREVEAFKVAVVLYADAYFMAPKGAKVKINQEIFKSLTRTDCIGQLNWCGYVLRLLMHSAKIVQMSMMSGQKTVTLDGCLLFWVVFYLDNMDFGALNTPHTLLPRIVDYPYAMVRILARADRLKISGSGMAEYGANKPRGQGDVIYSRNRAQVKGDRSREQTSQCDDSSATMMDNMINAFNTWEVVVNKATSQVREAMIQYFTTSGKTAEECQENGASPVRAPSPSRATRPLVPIDCGEVNSGAEAPVQHIVDDSEGSEVGDNEIEYFNISDSDDSEYGNVHPGFDGIGRPPSENGSYTWSTDREIDREEELQVELAIISDRTVVGVNRVLGRLASEQEGYQTMLVNDITVDVASFGPLTKFSVSPFTIGINHRDAPIEAQLTLQRVLAQVSDEEKESLWFIHEIPTMLKIDGKLLQGIFGAQFDITTTTMNALIRMYHQMDDEIYARWSERRWRHFLPADFALAAFSGEGGVAKDGVKEMFLNYNISYNVGECRLVMAPVLIHWHWCLYVWDFERKVIVVLDPMSMQLGEHHMAEKHSKSVGIMHGALTESKELYFPHPSESMEGWNVEFFAVQGAHGDSDNSGLYTMFYARYFDGRYLTRILTPEATKVQKCNLLCQLLTMFGNIGQPPPSIKAAIEGAY